MKNLSNREPQIIKHRHCDPLVSGEAIFNKVPPNHNEIASCLAMTFQKLFRFGGYAFTLVLLISFTTLISCKDDSDSTPSETDQQLITLQNNGTNWELSSAGVTKDGFDVTSQFTGFKLNIGNKTYTTENGLSPVWDASGSWDFIDNNPSLILKDGDTQITVSVISSALTLTFTADAVPTGGRVESVSGEYQFHLVSE